MITGTVLRDAVISASEQIMANRHIIDAMNVFPVPDGDTGTNLSMTLGAAAQVLAQLGDDLPVSDVAESTAMALLKGARGNSGVILSLIFRGVTKGFQNCQTADGADIARALECGVSSAYQAVLKPTEGTILTVVRYATEAAKKQAACGNDPVAVMQAALDGAKAALADTPNLLPILKKAGVVDAGGQGLVCIFESMLAVFKGEKADIALEAARAELGGALAAAGEEEIDFTYCTEFLVTREAGYDPEELRNYLKQAGGSLVFAVEEAQIKVHVHTDEPGTIIQYAQHFGALENIKIENMRFQHTEALQASSAETPQAALISQPQEPMQEPVKKPYGMVAVAIGEGQSQLFRELGVDAIVSGGQTMNPSTEEILAAVLSVPAERVFVLPNNKNIILAAEQTLALTERGVTVIHTTSVPQGIAAVLALNELWSEAENREAMTEAASRVATGLVTFAARDSVIDGQSVKKGEILGLEEGDITLTGLDATQTALQITANLFKQEETVAITVLYGADVLEEQAQILSEQLTERYGGTAEISVLRGGQPVYFYIISVE